MLLLMRLDATALMGYSGAVFARFFGSAFGALLAGAALLFWIAVPFAFGMRRFRHKDL